MICNILIDFRHRWWWFCRGHNSFNIVRIFRFDFRSISSVKRIQLIPVYYDLSTEYSVKNYTIRKSTKFFNIQSYNSSSSILFPNECCKQCLDWDCLLFDNRLNILIINIFYSQLSIYELNNDNTKGEILS